MSDTFAPPIASSAAPSRQRPGLETDLEQLNWQPAHLTPIQMRYADLDTMGHLNNTIYMQYLETARLLLGRDLNIWTPEEISRHDNRTVIARVEVDYRHEIRFGQAVVVQSLFERVGQTSWVVLSRILADDKPCAYSRVVQVRVDAQLRPSAITPHQRGILEQLLAQPMTGANR